MKAYTVCPVCKRKISTTCKGCITSITLVCSHGEKDVLEVRSDINWEILIA